MELSQYVEGLRRELGTLTRFAPAEVVQLADQLAEALESSVRLTLLEVLSAAAAEITEHLDETVIDVRLNAGEPEFVVTAVATPTPEPTPGPAADTGSEDAGTARMTLRLSESLKTRIEAQAAAAGMSVNSWLAHAAIRALDQRPDDSIKAATSALKVRVGQRISGYVRS
ncbi:MAG TPA: toxin-antitoxin system HicB family antitoxin [Streptosporangiaceae bacterium]|nr:toxin-antitoxin system HicB family antitoxin [Streptosporangiaceae bacterium]